MPGLNGSGTRQPTIPILMYHKVGAPVQSKADRFLNVSAPDFARQMRLLARLGYHGITFREACEGLAGRAGLPERPVCVTFDDGYTNVAEFAAPVLERRGWPGTVFVPTAYVGQANTWPSAVDEPILPIMDWTTLKGLVEAGWEMAGHSHSHPRLGDLSDDEALSEIATGKRELEENVGTSVSTFCYPFGSYNERTPELLRQAGFAGACTTRSGLAHLGLNPFLLPRVKIAYRDGAPGLLYRLLLRPHLP